jgi:hypothetical protein
LLLRPDVLFFLTDGGDLRPDQVQSIAKLNRGQTRICTVEIVTRQRRSSGMLEHLARTNGGAHRCIGATSPYCQPAF